MTVIERWVIAGCLAMSGTAWAAPVGTVAVIDRSVARVGDAVIWEYDLDVRAAGSGGPAQERAATLEMMIDDELIVAEARKSNIDVEKSEVLSALDEIKTQNKLDDAGLDALLKQYGYTRARYLVDLERQIMILRAKNQLVAPQVNVTDADVEAEAKLRKLPVPVTETDKSTISRELRRREIDALTVKWVADLRKRAWIERRP